MISKNIYEVLLGPHISEKATMVTKVYNQYTFRAISKATKIEIKQAIESIFKVRVQSITTLNQKGKVKNTTHGLGKRRNVKKVYVRLVDGQEIDFLGTKY